MPQLLRCVCPVHLSPSRSSHKSHQGSIGKRPHPQGKNSTPHRRHHSTIIEFCRKNMYFSFQGQFYEQVEGAAMGSLVSPIVGNLYVQYFEQKALSTASISQVLA